MFSKENFMTRKFVRRKRDGQKRAKKMKAATVPVATMPKKYFKQLMRLRQDGWKPLSQQIEKQPKPQEKKTKWHILRAKVVKELRGTRQEAEQEMDRLFAKASSGVVFFLEEVSRPRRRRIK